MKKHWIQTAIEHKGALHRQLGVPEGEKIPQAMLEHAAAQGGLLGKRAHLAMTLQHLGDHDEAMENPPAKSAPPARR